jgi:hypothetical protein
MVEYEGIETTAKDAEGANLGTRRAQMKLSGKRTLYPNQLWKIPSRDTDGVTSRWLSSECVETTRDESLRSTYRGAR